MISVICVGVALAMTIWLCRRLGVGSEARPPDRRRHRDLRRHGDRGGGAGDRGGRQRDRVRDRHGDAVRHDRGVRAAAARHGDRDDRSSSSACGRGRRCTRRRRSIATGFAYGPAAGDVATIVKLVRVLLLAPVVLGLGVWYAREKRQQPDRARHEDRPARDCCSRRSSSASCVLALANTLHLLPDFTLHLRDSFLWNAQDVHVVLAKLATDLLDLRAHRRRWPASGLGVDLRGLAQRRTRRALRRAGVRGAPRRLQLRAARAGAVTEPAPPRLEGDTFLSGPPRTLALPDGFRFHRAAR